MTTRGTPLLAGIAGALAAVAALAIASPRLAHAMVPATLSSMAGAALAWALWRALARALGSGPASLVPLLGTWPLVLNLVPALGRAEGDRLLLGIATGASALSIAALALAQHSSASGPWWHARLWPRLLAGILFAYAILASIAACVVHARFGFWGRDEAVFLQSMWSSTHGAGFANTLEGDPVSHFAIHNSPLLFAWWPFFYLLPRAETLLVLNALAVAAAPIPMYFLARLTLPRLPSAALALAFLTHPFVLGTPTLTLTEAANTYLPLATALLGAAARRPGIVWAGALGLIAVQEYLGLALVAVGALCLLRRLRVTGVLLALVGLAWLGLTIFVVFPHFGSVAIRDTGFTCRYGHLGRTPAEALARFASEPAAISWRMAREHKEWIYYALVPAAGPIPWLGTPSWASIVILYPVLLQGAAMSPHKFAAWPPFLYAAIPIGCLALARILAHRGFGTEDALRPRITLVVAILAIGGGIGAYRGWAYYRGPQMSAAKRALAREALRLIPPDADVSAPDMLLPALAFRREVRVVWWSRPTEWILAETEPLRPGYTAQGVSRTVLDEGRYERVFAKDGLELWRRGAR